MYDSVVMLNGEYQGIYVLTGLLAVGGMARG